MRVWVSVRWHLALGVHRTLYCPMIGFGRLITVIHRHGVVWLYGKMLLRVVIRS